MAAPKNARDIFLAALERAPADRIAYLDEACGDDAALRLRVESLLRANDELGAFLSEANPPLPNGEMTVDSDASEKNLHATQAYTPQPESSATLEHRSAVEPGLVIAGRYTLHEKIGEGGMGEVWVARQSEPVKRNVALKLIKTGMDSKAVLTRFEQERQALAMMDHPNIARVLDGGITPTGQPFFVMELVNGLPLNKFCDEMKLAPKERLELFVPICQAVQHAHQKGIVHRDLKPANILVTMIDGKPVPKVIDFGVAKATAGKLTDESMSTQFGAVVGTLEYMSPEQAGFAGEDVDTRADIYSLGVILYESLTGLRPIDAKRLRKAALTEMIRIIREEEPSKPSTRLSTDDALPSLAALRQTEPKRLMALLRGELDWVVMKCLEKDRTRRYDTANALSRDIQRYLADEVVEARPPSAGYRMSKFLKRNKGTVIAASFVWLALIAGLIGTAYGLFRADRARQAEAAQRQIAVAEKKKAEKREQLAIDAVKKFRDAVAENPELKKNPSLDSLRKTLLKEPLAFFKELRSSLQADRDTSPDSLARLASASLDLAVLTGEIGDRQDAITAFREARSLYGKLADEESGDTRHRRALSGCYNSLGNFLAATSRLAEAEAEYRLAIALDGKLADAYPAVTEFRARLAADHHNLGDLLYQMGKPAEAEAEYRRAIPLSQKATEEEPSTTSYRQFLANHHNSLAIVLRDAGKQDEAEAELRESLTVVQKLADENPDVAEFQSELGQCHQNLAAAMSVTGTLAGAGTLANAEAEFRMALTLTRKAVDASPSSTEFRFRLATCRRSLGALLTQKGDSAGAEAELREAIRLSSKLTDDNPAVTAFRSNLADSHNLLAWLLSETGRPAEAEAEYRRGIAHDQTLADENAAVVGFTQTLAEHENELGLLLKNSGKPAEAEIPLRKGLVVRQKLADDHPDVVDFRCSLAGSHHGLAQVMALTGKPAEAEAEYRKAIELSQQALVQDPGHGQSRRYLLNHLVNLGGLLTRTGRPAEAAALFRRALELDPTESSARAGLRDADGLVAMLDRLPALLRGDDEPTTNDERLVLARLCVDRKQYRMAVRLFADALAADPRLGNDRQAQYRYNAACAAALAASGQGDDDPRPDHAAKARLRKQALEWLKDELSAWKLASITVEQGNKGLVAATLAHWKQDADLASIRDEKELAKLPEDERRECLALWADVDALLMRRE